MGDKMTVRSRPDDPAAFIELVQKKAPSENGSPVSAPTQRKAKRVISEMADVLFSYLNDRFSFLSLLTLGDDFFDDGREHYEFLVAVLADTGVLFPEARPVADGCFSPRALEVIRRSNFWRTADKLHYRGRSVTAEKAEWDEPIITAMVKDAKESSESEDTSELRSRLIKERNEAKRNLDPLSSISKELLLRVNKAEKDYTRLKAELIALGEVGCDPLYWLRDWFANKNGAYNGIDRDDPEFAGQDSISTWIGNVSEKVLSIGNDNREFDDCGFRNLVLSVSKAFCRFAKIPDNGAQTSTIYKSANCAVAISRRDSFSFSYENSADCNFNITFDPVISYLILKKYKAQILHNGISQVTIDAFLPEGRAAYHVSSAKEESALNDFNLYADLRAAYSDYHGKFCAEEVRAIWDISFLRCSGYFEKSFRFVLDTIEKSASLSEDAFFLLRQIKACSKSNRLIDLARTPLFRQNRMLDRFHPEKPDDQGWKQLSALRNLIEKKETSLIAEYQSVITRPYSDHDIIDVIDSYIDSERSRQLFEQLHFKEVFPEITPVYDDGSVDLRCTGVIRAAIEYTLRTILSERCEERLYHWLKTFALMPPDGDFFH